MPSDRPAAQRGPRCVQQQFATTRWTLVLQAGRSDTASAGRALAELCEQYWYPLYAYARSRGLDAEDARDSTQSFFALLLEKGGVGVADRSRGRFRTFLLSSMQNFLASEWRKRQALKRGGDADILSLDYDEAEESWLRDPSADLDPEAVFERKWALSLLERALADLERQYDESGRAELFAALRGTVTGAEPPRPYPELAAELGLNEGALRTAISRLRSRWRERIRELVAETVEGEKEIQDELQFLISALGV